MYARGDSGVPQTYQDVRRRLQQRYGQNEPAYNVRLQLREIKRLPGERLEVFADRLQEVAQRGKLDPQDRDELFYFTFLNAVRDTPKMQNFIENAHMRNRNLKLSDLLALSQEYLSRSPTVLRRTVAVNVCRTGKPTGKLVRTDDEEAADSGAEAAAPLVMVTAKPPADGSAEQPPTMEMLREMETYIHKRITYVNKEVDWAKTVLKLRKLHHGLNSRRRRKRRHGHERVQEVRRTHVIPRRDQVRRDEEDMSIEEIMSAREEGAPLRLENDYRWRRRSAYRRMLRTV